MVAGRKEVSVHFGEDSIDCGEVRRKLFNESEIVTMDVVYCDERKTAFIIVSSKVQQVLSQIQVFNFKLINLVTLDLPSDEIVVSIDGYYDVEKKKIVFVTADTNGTCKYYEY